MFKWLNCGKAPYDKAMHLTYSPISLPVCNFDWENFYKEQDRNFPPANFDKVVSRCIEKRIKDNVFLG